MTKITGTVHEDVFTFITISRWILLRMRNVSNKSYKENQKTHFVFKTFSRNSYPLWDNVEKHGGAREAANGNTILCRHMACCINKAKRARICTCSRVRATTTTHTQAHECTHRHTHTDYCNTHCFSKASMVSWTRLNMALYVKGGLNMAGTNCDLFTHKMSRSYLNHLVHCLSCYKHIWCCCICSKTAILKSMKYILVHRQSVTKRYSRQDFLKGFVNTRRIC